MALRGRSCRCARPEMIGAGFLFRISMHREDRHGQPVLSPSQVDVRSGAEHGRLSIAVCGRRDGARRVRFSQADRWALPHPRGLFVRKPSPRNASG
ncbi:Hypothetical protein MexAM1_META1p5187 [Methylorubrum extorquens AM1]|uniref:Uncharacterized protein n=1 Tax=Methylorubrum extorquens (strain ATCC 14718 / DSM 1338 / JCM 2805 / NCIMB 9133 / AM1) TaxID=272630 RepID=C5AV04_METEA|nr:Hypothetical protein MexAM1_META1p5187 [Methylorubrum extorquens AM1]